MNDHPYAPEQFILHIPHSSVYIPEECRKLFCLNEKQLREELLMMTDSYTNELFGAQMIPKENQIIFPYSRLVCDVERFRDDKLEMMAARGMGVCYTATSQLTVLKRAPESHRKEMLRLYDQHHLALTAAADRALQQFGCGLLIDCHSFASKALPYEMLPNTADKNRPDICIGTDMDFHTPAWLRDELVNAFTIRGYSVAIDYPFSGTLVPMKHYHQDNRLLSAMIEVNRGIYMDERTGERKESFHQLQKHISEIMAGLLEDTQKGIDR